LASRVQKAHSLASAFALPCDSRIFALAHIEALGSPGLTS
jgi:hypothetical protein